MVLREPTVVAFIGENENKKLLAAGVKAVQMQGRAPEKTTVVCPVSDGYIVDADACVVLMKEFIKRILPTYVIFPRIRALLAVPTGLTVGERKVYEDVLRAAGVNEIMLVDNVIVTALGFDLPVTSAEGGLVVNVGGGVTEIAIISLCGTISGCSVNVGGNMMDKALIDFLVGIKEEIGSLYPNDIASMEVKGINTNTMTPSSLNVYATDVYEALLPYYARIAEAVEGITNLCPPELASGIHGMGLFAAGGASRMPGFDKVLKEVLNIPVTIGEDPEYTAISGAGKLLGNKELLNAIRAQQ